MENRNETSCEIPRHAIRFFVGVPVRGHAECARFGCPAYCRWIRFRDRAGLHRIGGGIGDAFEDCLKTGLAEATVWELAACGITAGLLGTAGHLPIMGLFWPRFRLAEYGGLPQRFALVSVATACIVAAARFYPRDDGMPRSLQASAALGLGTVGAAGIAWIAVTATQDLGERDRWRAMHRELANDAHHAADIEKLSGVVQIDPTGVLAIDVAIKTRTPPPSVRSLVSTFNPGMTIEKLFLDGQPAEFGHEDGGLVIVLPEARTPDDGMVLRLTATGIPDSSFAFLASVFDLGRLPASNRVGLLGTEASLYQQDYVALMPSVYWLPSSVPIVQNPDRHDVFAVDLAVTVPDGWLAVGPGGRTLEHNDPPTYRFRPRNMVSGVALFAGPFRAYNARVDDVEVELALHPKQCAIRRSATVPTCGTAH